MNKHFKLFLVIVSGVAVGVWIAWQFIKLEKECAALKLEKAWENRPQIGFSPQPAAAAA